MICFEVSIEVITFEHDTSKPVTCSEIIEC